MSSKVTKEEAKEVHTGLSSSYYVTDKIIFPTSLPEPYQAECNDITEVLKMTPAEVNVFKAIWRRAAHRLGKRKAGNNTTYDAEKIEFFGDRIVIDCIKDMPVEVAVEYIGKTIEEQKRRIDQLRATQHYLMGIE